MSKVEIKFLYISYISQNLNVDPCFLAFIAEINTSLFTTIIISYGVPTRFDFVQDPFTYVCMIFVYLYCASANIHGLVTVVGNNVPRDKGTAETKLTS